MKNCFSHIPELTPTGQEFLRILRAAANGHAPDAPPTDWAAIIELAFIHHVSGFLYLAVCAWASPFQPNALLMAQWRFSFLSAASTYTRVAIQTRELLTALHAEGIRVIPLKGIWLAEHVYEDGACRPMCDIDLLVPGEELARARIAVERIGYTTTEFYLANGNNKHVHYQKEGAPLHIELHWHLWHASTESIAEPDLKRIWTGLHEELLHGVPVLAFPPERQLIHLTQHILQHALTVPLKSYLDLILFCRRYAPQLSLPRLNEEAGAWQVSFGAKFVLQVACDIWAVDPTATLTAFLPSGDEHHAARRTALCATIQLSCESKQITHALASFCQASWFHRFRLVLSRIFYPANELRQNCPMVVRRFGLVGGYLWRGADLIRRYSPTLRKVSVNRHAVDTSLANFTTRQTLSKWLRSQEAQR